MRFYSLSKAQQFLDAHPLATYARGDVDYLKLLVGDLISEVKLANNRYLFSPTSVQLRVAFDNPEVFFVRHGRIYPRRSASVSPRLEETGYGFDVLMTEFGEALPSKPFASSDSAENFATRWEQFA